MLYTVAMGVHFVTSDYGLSLDYRGAYHRHARWVLAAALLAGWLVGSVVVVSELAVQLLFAVLAGAVVLNVMKEELPEERRSRFLPFLGGLFGYALVLQFA